MFMHQGIWLPDGEKHFPEWMTRNGELVDGRGTYQIKKLNAALQYCQSFRNAVDVGAHVGLWSMHLAKRFEHLHAFEPMDVFRSCFALNVDADNVTLYPWAIGADKRLVSMAYDPRDSGGTHVNAAIGNVPMHALDSLDLQCVDFLKIDCEGYESQVIQGALNTISIWRPVIVVEQKRHKLVENYGEYGTPAVDALLRLGASVVKEMSGDYIMRWL